MPGSDTHYTYRAGTAEDAQFLREMLYEAATWDQQENRPPIDRVLAHPELHKILAGWGSLKGDASIVAEDAEGKPAGAVWYRFWTREHHSFGFVDESIPELGLGVKASHRRRGVGGRLLEEIIRHARFHGVTGLSLSVIPENPALRLYRRAGFEKAAENGDAWTMMLEL